MMELLEYVLLNATFPGPSGIPLLTLVVVALAGDIEFDAELDADANPALLSIPLELVLILDIRPLELPLDIVSSESVPSIESDTTTGSGGASPGARSPFFPRREEEPPAEVEADRPEEEDLKKRPFALGAEATRRMNRDAEAPMLFGERGLPPLDEDGGEGIPKETCEGCAVCAFVLGGVWVVMVLFV